MLDSHAVADLAHATIPVPPSQVHLGNARHDVFLRPTSDNRYRWYHADGTKTVVEGRSIEHAIHVAEIVWRDVHLVSRAPD